MKLFLSGGGSTPSDLEKRFIKEIDPTKPLLYIPLAMYEKDHPYTECYKWIQKFYLPLYFNNIFLASNLHKYHLQDAPFLGSMHIGGGNTFKLLKEIRESGFDKIIQFFIDNNLPIAGGSAGAVIFGKDIKSVIGLDKNKEKLKDLNSLDKLKGYDIWPHYTVHFDKRIESSMKRYKINKIIALSEDAGVYVHDNKIEVIGKSAFVFIDSTKIEFKPGESIE